MQDVAALLIAVRVTRRDAFVAESNPGFVAALGEALLPFVQSPTPSGFLAARRALAKLRSRAIVSQRHAARLRDEWDQVVTTVTSKPALADLLQPLLSANLLVDRRAAERLSALFMLLGIRELVEEKAHGSVAEMKERLRKEALQDSNRRQRSATPTRRSR